MKFPAAEGEEDKFRFHISHSLWSLNSIICTLVYFFD